MSTPSTSSPSPTQCLKSIPFLGFAGGLAILTLVFAITSVFLLLRLRKVSRQLQGKLEWKPVVLPAKSFEPDDGRSSFYHDSYFPPPSTVPPAPPTAGIGGVITPFRLDQVAPDQEASRVPSPLPPPAPSPSPLPAGAAHAPSHTPIEQLPPRPSSSEQQSSYFPPPSSFQHRPSSPGSSSQPPRSRRSSITWAAPPHPTHAFPAPPSRSTSVASQHRPRPQRPPPVPIVPPGMGYPLLHMNSYPPTAGSMDGRYPALSPAEMAGRYPVMPARERVQSLPGGRAAVARRNEAPGEGRPRTAEDAGRSRTVEHASVARRPRTADDASCAMRAASREVRPRWSEDGVTADILPVYSR